MVPQGAGPRYRADVLLGASELVLFVWLAGVFGVVDIGGAQPVLLMVALGLVGLGLLGQRRGRDQRRS
jgi:hypothetical protein